MTSAQRDEAYIVVVGFDFSEMGELALRSGIEVLKLRSSASLKLVHVAAGYGPLLRLDIGEDVRTVGVDEANAFLRSHVDALLKSWQLTEFASRIETSIRVGAASDQVVQAAKDWQADLVLIGTHGRKGVPRLLLGSVAESIVRKAGCPVLVIREKNHQLSPENE